MSHATSSESAAPGGARSGAASADGVSSEDASTGTVAGRRTVRPVGDRSLLVECRNPREVTDLHAALTLRPLPGQVDVLAAAQTVLVRLQSASSVGNAASVLAEMAASTGQGIEPDLITIDTLYDGADLARVAELTGLSPEGVAQAHAGQVWTAAFTGFAPGFVYLRGENHVLDVPRRETPRVALPAGSVALGGEFSAVYPRQSPGGWQLIGRTDARMWDLGRDRPSLIRTGDRVRYRAVRELVELAAQKPERVEQTVPADELAGLTVVAPGVQSLIEDQGRPGYLDLGVCPSGALDRGASWRANRLVGNDRDAAVIETLLGGLQLTARGDHVLAVTGAPATLQVRSPDGAVLSRPCNDSAFALRDGEGLVLGIPPAGLRSYVAVRGGFDVQPVLGSRSTDIMSGLGPPALQSGMSLAVGSRMACAVVSAPDPQYDRPQSPGVVTVAVVPGPRSEWVTPSSLQQLYSTSWTVTDQTNRVGLRLDGQPLARSITSELPSEGAVRGAIQIPASGLPVVFLADHPITGGYPVVAVVRDADLDSLAQLRPGDELRFTAVQPASHEPQPASHEYDS